MSPEAREGNDAPLGLGKEAVRGWDTEIEANVPGGIQGDQGLDQAEGIGLRPRWPGRNGAAGIYPDNRPTTSLSLSHPGCPEGAESGR